MSISVGYLLLLVSTSLMLSYLMASVLLGKGSLPACLKVENWTVGTGILFVFFEFIFGSTIYLQASGQVPTLFDVAGF